MTRSGMQVLVTLACLAGLLSALVFEAQAQPVTRVYRADWRAPDDVFQHGIAGRGTNMDLLAHALEGSCDDPDPARASVWVSTVTRVGDANRFAQRQLGDLITRPVPGARMWIYTVRADHTYLSVPGIVSLVAAFASQGELGYTPQHGADLRYLLQNSLILAEDEVVTHYIDPGQIESAVPVSYNQRNSWIIGSRVSNPRFVDLQTEAGVRGVFNVLVPPASIHRQYARHTAAAAPTSCLMPCDRASRASSSLLLIDAHDTAPSPEADCSAATRGKGLMTPLMRQLSVIFDFFGDDRRNDEL